MRGLFRPFVSRTSQSGSTRRFVRPQFAAQPMARYVTGRKTVRLRSVGLLMGLVLAGCQPAEPPADVTAPSAPVEPAPAPAENLPAASSEPEVSVEIRSWAEVQELIAARRGKVVVVDIWSTYCVPCMREFPGLVALQREHAPDVACISVDVDYFGDVQEPPESFRDKVLDFLRKQQAQLANVICSDPDEKVFQALETSSVPVVLVYDRQGQLRKKFAADEAPAGSEGFTYAEHIAPLVQQLLAEPPAASTDKPQAK